MYIDIHLNMSPPKFEAVHLSPFEVSGTVAALHLTVRYYAEIWEAPFSQDHVLALTLLKGTKTTV